LDKHKNLNFKIHKATQQAATRHKIFKNAMVNKR